MKYFALLLLMLFTTFGTHAQIVNIPDPNFKDCLLNNHNIDTNNDLEIQVTEALAFTGQIHCESNGITDLTGIEAFVNLSSLSIVYNNLSSVDLSSNLALTTINFLQNSLTALDLSNNAALRDLYVQSNAISTLDISDLQNLERLVFSENQIASIDVSNNPDLITFRSEFNPLTALDLSNNVNLDHLDCRWNQIESIDLSNNPVIRRISVSTNKLTELNLKNGNNPNIEYIEAISNPGLGCIQVDDVAYCEQNWTGNDFHFDQNAYFSENCALGSGDNSWIDKVMVYPNPATDVVNLSIPCNIRIFELSGKLLMEKQEVLNVDVSGLSPGMYLLELYEDRQDLIRRIKLVKK